jgi:hypothetical protein
MNDKDVRQSEFAVLPRPTFFEMATSAIGFWEPLRVVYNLVLAAIVVGFIVIFWPHSVEYIDWRQVPRLIVLAVLANVCYCAAYLVDLFVQLSGFHSIWLRVRWVLFVIGTLFAAALTTLIMADLVFLGPLD